MKTITILDIELYDRDWPSENMADAVEWFAEKLELVPEQYRHKAKMTIGAVDEYGSARPYIEITYSRPMTSAEIRAEREFERQRLAQRAELLEAELRQLRREI